ncbi:hypothetical protein [Tabrizicola fusiformis]|uniref:hypothetical protein n=1 Tax=Tabrizicola sp. SY72 TaxID=2741673 RepID=UPI001573A7F5|nr:hypothetical protein [Tabrizicola sp. SY72]NTT85729.1 hypothetical protein [Tabrizicola sp. SY72]
MGRDEWNELLSTARKSRDRIVCGIHGELHWRAVAAIGLSFCENFPCLSPNLALAFGMLHDCRRQNDHFDPGHGPRAAELARHSDVIRSALTSDEVEALAVACEQHDKGTVSSIQQIGACFDADRFNLVRVGIMPDRRFFSLPWSQEQFHYLVNRAAALSRDPPEWEELFSKVLMQEDTSASEAALPTYSGSMDFSGALAGQTSLFERRPEESLSVAESEVARKILACANGSSLYHGGKGGLRLGDKLLPSRLTGNDPRGWAKLAYCSTSVHVTADLDIAREYSKIRISGGAVYRVIPVGDLRVNPAWMRAAVSVSARPDVPFPDVLKVQGLAAWVWRIYPALMCDSAIVACVEE